MIERNVFNKMKRDEICHNLPSKKYRIDFNYTRELETPQQVDELQEIKKAEICPFDNLPLFVIAEILSHTGHENMMNVLLVNKKFNKAAKTKKYYESMLLDKAMPLLREFEIHKKDYILIPKCFEEKSWEELFSLKTIIKNDQKNTNKKMLGTKIIKKIGFYEGEIFNKKEEGVGVLYKVKQGLIYQGEFEKGKICGKGTRIWTNNDEYIGQFKDSKRNGFGILKLNNLGTYKGNFSNDKREGEGEMFFDNGDYFKGNWKNDMANGKGVFKNKGGYEYDGDWVNNQKEGFGTLVYQKGIYVGEWKNNKAHGRGKINFKSGSVYEGEMVENCWHGNGVFTWEDGRRYEGQFVNSKQEGKGKIFNIDGTLCYDGCFKDNRPHGKGVLSLKSNFRYEGKMKNGLKHGFGSIFNPSNQICFSGKFSHGKLVEDINCSKQLTTCFKENFENSINFASSFEKFIN